jgi:hypothetical protein
MESVERAGLWPSLCEQVPIGHRPSLQGGAYVQLTRGVSPAPQDVELNSYPIAEITKLEALDGASDLVFASGSLVEKLGNPWSDLDIYVLTDRDPIGPTVAVEGGCTVSIHYIGELRVDYEFWPVEQVQELAQRLASFRPGSGAIVSLFSETEEQFIHRLLRCSIPVVGDLAPVQAMFSVEALQAYQIQIGVKLLDSLHEDLCGMMEGKNWEVALFTARELVAAAMDVYLHIRGNSNPTRKWRASLIQRYAAPDDAFVIRFYDLQFPSGAELLASPALLVEYCRSCIAYHATIVRIAHRD